MRFIETFRKSQARFKGMKLPKWEDCKQMTPEEFDRLWGDCVKLPCAPQDLLSHNKQL